MWRGCLVSFLARQGAIGPFAAVNCGRVSANFAERRTAGENEPRAVLVLPLWNGVMSVDNKKFDSRPLCRKREAAQRYTPSQENS